MKERKITSSEKRFVEENHNLIYSFLHKHKLQVDDYYGVAAIGLCKAAMTFNKEKDATFSTYAYKVMLNEVLQEKRKLRSQKRCILQKTTSYQKNMGSSELSLEKTLCSTESVEDEVVTTIYFRNLFNNMSEREKTVIRALVNGKTQMEITKILNCSQSTVSRVINGIRKKW